MERPYILHMFTPGRHISPFDINMAADAGYQHVVPYGEVALDAVAALTQDAIFSRGPKGAQRTAIFIGGRDALLAVDMLERAQAVMFKPFVVSLMADPSGAYTTAAAMVACVEAALDGGLAQRRVLVLGGTGPVGRMAGVLAAQAGAQVRLCSRNGGEDAARETAARFGVALSGALAGDRAALAEAEVLLACGAAGVQLAAADDIAAATRLQAVADVNAVPPSGISGLAADDDGKPLRGDGNGERGVVGFGALAIGNLKYQTQQRLLSQMRETGAPQVLALAEAFAAARALLAERRAAKAT